MLMRSKGILSENTLGTLFRVARSRFPLFAATLHHTARRQRAIFRYSGIRNLPCARATFFVSFSLSFQRDVVSLAYEKRNRTFFLQTRYTVIS